MGATRRVTLPLGRARARAAGLLTLVAIALIGGLLYALAPRLLSHNELFPAMARVPKWTRTARGRMGDPVNVALIGTAAEVARAFRAAGWAAADPLSRASDLGIVGSVVFNRPDSTAPVSSLFLFGRRQDVAFEQEVGPSARRRHHVRLWRDSELSYAGRPVWVGAATFDARAGLSRRGLHPTHHIAPDIDAERDGLVAALARAGRLMATFRVSGVGVRLDAHNAEGDRFETDGELRVAVVASDTAQHPPPVDPGVPPLVALKDRLWRWRHQRERTSF